MLCCSAKVGSETHNLYTAMLVLIILSLLLQVNRILSCQTKSPSLSHLLLGIWPTNEMSPTFFILPTTDFII